MLVISFRFFQNNTIKEYTDCLKLDIKFITLLLLETTNFLLQILKIEPMRKHTMMSVKYGNIHRCESLILRRKVRFESR